MYSITNNVTVDGRTLLAHTKVVDANNHVTGQFSNSLGQLVLVREYSGTYPNPSASADTRYTYDAAGNLTAVRQSNWNNSQPATFLSETGMTYDGFGRKISMNDPDMGNWTYAYNAAGSLTEQRDANLARLCFYYDELDRLTNKRHDNNNDGCGTGDTRLAYYAYYGSGAGKVGKPSEIRWGSSDTQNRETFDYDSLGRLITHNRWVDSRQYTMSYSGFDALHRPGTRVLTWPNGNTHTTSVTYDHEGENTLVGGGSTLVTAVGYNDMGQLKRIALNNGLSTWYGYSGYETSGNNDAYDMKEVTWNWGTNRSFGKLWRICTAAHANTRCQAAEKDLSVNGQVLDMRHSYDNVGNVAAVRDYVNANQLQTFGYDHLNRLTSAGTNSAGSGQYTHTYAYNTLGNITSYNGATYTYGSSLHKHAVTAANGVSYSYDANGNMTLRDAAGTVNDYTQNFNVENELASVVNNGSTTSFTYDANGIRTKTVAPSGVTTYYPFPGYEEEVNGSTITRRITYSIAGQAVALRVQIVSGSNTLYYLHTDHLGSTSLATTTGGAVVAGSTARYYPFGDWRTEPTAGLTDRGFTGHLHNNIGNAPDDIGLVYMNARWYLPYINRFLSADSIVPDPANPQSFNRYTYSLNNPIRYSDPTGHKACSFTNSGECIDITHLPFIPSGPLLNFATANGINYFDEVSGQWVHIPGVATSWSASEKRAATAAALQDGAALAEVINAAHPGWDVTPGQAFLMVHKGAVTLTKVGIGCNQDPLNGGASCGARTMSSRSIRVYTDADEITYKSQWIGHELGHAFVNAVGSATPIRRLTRAINENPLLARAYSRTDFQGFGSTHAHPWLWQHSESSDPREIFADMYLGWSYNTWEASSAGEARSNFMTGNVSLLVDLALRR